MTTKTYALAVRRVVNLQATCVVNTEGEDFLAFAEYYDREDYTEEEIIDEYVEQASWHIESEYINEEEVTNCGEIK